jgi:hypothetical protein
MASSLLDAFRRQAAPFLGELLTGNRALGTSINNGNPDGIIRNGARVLQKQYSESRLDLDNDGRPDITRSGNLVDSDRDGIPDYEERGNNKFRANTYTGNSTDIDGDGIRDRNSRGDLFDKNKNAIPDYQERGNNRDYSSRERVAPVRYSPPSDERTYRALPDTPRVETRIPPRPRVEAQIIDDIDTRQSPRAPAQSVAKDTMTIQAGLTLMGIDVGKIDGISGSATRQGIQTYARQHPDLHLDPNDRESVLAAIQNDLKTDPDVQTRMATIIGEGRNADKNESRAVQAALNGMGARLDVDGSIGRKTIQAYNDAMDQSYAPAAAVVTPAAERKQGAAQVSQGPDSGLPGVAVPEMPPAVDFDIGRKVPAAPKMG